MTAVTVRAYKVCAMSADDDKCHEEVHRNGGAEPCDKQAVAMRRDPEEGQPYPVCCRHARSSSLMVPLSELIVKAAKPETEWNHVAAEPNDDILIHLVRDDRIGPAAWNELRWRAARAVYDLMEEHGIEAKAECGAQAAPWIPCMRDHGHGGPHWSRTGGTSTGVTWADPPKAEPETGEQLHDWVS